MTPTTTTPPPIPTGKVVDDASPSTRVRLDSVDTLRGLVMILMVLDHVRDYFSNVEFSPLDLTQTTPALFFTRWVTHFCAPVFVLLAGVSAFLWAASPNRRKVDVARYLLVRGVWLIILELTVIRFAWFFNINYEVSLAQVIWAIGWSMIGLAGLVFLPNGLILAIATVMIVGHNLFDSVSPGTFGSFDWLWTVLHRGGWLEPWPGHQFLILYPLIPWVGVMALGYALGPLFLKEQGARRKWFLGLGLVFILAFVVLRVPNAYGNPTFWSTQKDSLFTFLSFINLEKYPPSLLFLLVTLGPAFMILALLERARGNWARPIAVFGRVPLFFYVLHLYLIHTLAVGLALAHYHQADWLFGASWLFRRGFPDDYGYNLPGVVIIWLGVVIVLYPACRWFANFKRGRRDWWLSFL